MPLQLRVGEQEGESVNDEKNTIVIHNKAKEKSMTELVSTAITIKE